MAITRRTDYAVRLMYELAHIPVGATLSFRDLCDSADVPESFGKPLVEFLAEAGLIATQGYRGHLLSLGRSAHEVTMAEIVRVCEPGFSLSQCVPDPGCCQRSPHCGVHQMWAGIDALVWIELESVTLEQVVSGRAAVPAPAAEPAELPGLTGTS